MERLLDPVVTRWQLGRQPVSVIAALNPGFLRDGLNFLTQPVVTNNHAHFPITQALLNVYTLNMALAVPEIGRGLENRS
jgi:hypothetical protein